MKKKILTIAIALCGIALQAQNTPSDKDKKFVTEAAEGGMLEVKLGELAQTNSSSAEVKNLGSQMVNDHSKANDELRSLANSKNIPLPASLGEKCTKTYTELSKKTGKDFDKAYTECMVKDHTKDISEFKKEAQNGSDADLKSWASNKISVLEHHKDMAVQTCKAIKSKT